MSTEARLLGYSREKTPSGVWIEYNLDNPDSPPHILWPNMQPDLVDESSDDKAGSTDDSDEEVAYGIENRGCIVAEPSGDEDEDIMDDEEEDAQPLESPDWEVQFEEESAASTERKEKVLDATQKKSDTGGEVTEDSVGYSTGLFYNPQTGEASTPAIYHHEIRHELFQAANMRGTYAHPQPRGRGLNDETSFLEEQRNWGTQRAHYPPIIFEYRRLDRKNPAYEVEHWYHLGKIVLDCEGIPIRRFINIPNVLSSEYPGHFMEANRRQDSRIQNRDFAARMPPARTGRNPDGQIILEFPKTASTLSSRTRRFRLRAGCLAWISKPCPAMSSFMEEHLPQDLKDRNTTKGFRDLTPGEMVGVQSKSFGHVPQRSRYNIPTIHKSSEAEGVSQNAEAKQGLE